MENYTITEDNLNKELEKMIKVLDNLTCKDPSIIRQDVLEKYEVNLRKLFPDSIADKFDISSIAHEVIEGKLYDLSFGPYSLIALVSTKNRKANDNEQRFMVLYNDDLIFKLFTDIRAINKKIISKDNGIWAYKNDSELYSNRDMAKRMVEKLEAERNMLQEERAETLFALQAASIESNVTTEAMEFLLRELELPKF